MVLVDLFFLLSCGWIINCAKKIPTDLEQIRISKLEGSQYYKSDLGFFILAWFISVMLFIFVVYPMLVIIINGLLQGSKLFQGFY